MAKSKVGKKTVQSANSYFALKSQNEIYYQMASIFKEITNVEDKLAKKNFNGFLKINQSEIFLENLL
ncbi:hypothetical protein [Desulfobacula sp.]|uniref:hypothetical protein n=1 Tax=Desulfobacula sp. TaxID=2593537 RepID=UPI002609E1FF|nr:hypothetical protein [Desulfobacula sp.]